MAGKPASFWSVSAYNAQRSTGVVLVVFSRSLDVVRAVVLGCLFWTASSQAATTLDLSQYKGKVVYLDFWASWCKPCRESFPWMDAMHKKYGGQGLVVIAVNVDEDRRDADHFLKDFPTSVQVVYDPEGALASQYKLIGMPSSFLIGRDGNVVAKHQGFFEDSPSKFEAEIQQQLAGAAPVP